MSTIKKIFVSRSFDESFELGCEDEYEAISDVIKLSRHENISLTKAESSSSTPEEESLKKIKEADLVIFLLGRRYGTIYDQANNLSYIHAEYRKAVKENKKKLIYLFPLNEKDTQYEYCKKFREEVENPENRGHSKFAKIEDIVKTHDIAKEIIQLKRNDLGVSEKPSSGDIQAYCLFLGSKIKEDIEKEFLEEKKPLNLYSSVPDEPDKYFTRDTHITNIKAQLKENKIVAIVGMGGIGKTTLATVLGHDTDLRKEFKDGIYYLILGQEYEKDDVLCKLFYNLTGEQSDPILYEEKIKEVFAEKRTLLILDDIWKKKHFQDFPTAPKESYQKILITTRFNNLPNCSNYKIEKLDIEESLAMLEKKLGLASMDSESKSIARRMAEKCDGLPLAINIVAKTLAENLNRWKDIENSFNTILDKAPADDYRVDKDDQYRTVYASIQLSINYLEEELRDRYFSLSILFNKHSSFFESETLRVYWGSNPWYILESLKEASLLTEQISRKGQKQYTLHDLQKTFIKEKTKEQDLTNYKKQFIQNYQKKYAPDWHKIPFYEQGSFYYNYLEICKDLNEQSLAKEISEDVLYNNAHISLPIVQKIINFLGIDLKKEAPKILKTNSNLSTVAWSFSYLTSKEKKDFANVYLEKAIKQDFEAVNSYIITQCFKEADEELRKDFINKYLLLDFDKIDENIIRVGFKFAEKDNQRTIDYADNYIKKKCN